MTNKIPKAAYQIVLAFFILAFTVIACNNKKSTAPKEPPPDTATVKPATTAPVEDTVNKKGPVDPIKDPPTPQ
jgi:hypothetical protein